MTLTIAAQLMVIYLPVCNRIFKTLPLTLYEMTLVIVFSLVIFTIAELEKLIRNLLTNKLPVHDHPLLTGNIQRTTFSSLAG
ncbi:MAG: cation transporting ATPase C-terminal domain-containing protein [Bacteroidota bacterium]